MEKIGAPTNGVAVRRRWFDFSGFAAIPLLPDDARFFTNVCENWRRIFFLRVHQVTFSLLKYNFKASEGQAALWRRHRKERRKRPSQAATQEIFIGVIGLYFERGGKEREMGRWKVSNEGVAHFCKWRELKTK